MKLTMQAPDKSPRPANVQAPVATPQQRWQELLQAPLNPGLVLQEAGLGPVMDTGPQSPAAEAFAGTVGFACALPDLAVLEVRGADAISFLQGQFTNDIAALTEGQAQRTGLCSPKGRLLADFLVLRQADSVLLLLSQALAEPMRKRLSMYVLRAKVVITDVSDQLLPVGFVARTEAAQTPLSTPWPAAMTVQTTETPAATSLLGLEALQRADYAWQRLIMLVAPTQLLATLQACQADYGLAPTSWWHTGEVLAGTARLAPATSDAFVPQMINFELVGGVSFNKGCFPGQEIVARTQYLGKLKRRLSLASLAGTEPVLPGTEVHDEQGEVMGLVLLAAPAVPPAPQDQQWVLFESRTAELEKASQLKVGDAVLTLDQLPYPIPVAERFERPDL